MAYARYYIRRSSNPTNLAIEFDIDTKKGWESGEVRGKDKNGKALSSIAFVGSPGKARLTIPVTAQDASLVGAIYEVVFYDAKDKSTDFRHQLASSGQSSPDIQVSDPGNAMDDDPPPTPLDWDFKPIVGVK